MGLATFAARYTGFVSERYAGNDNSCFSAVYILKLTFAAVTPFAKLTAVLFSFDTGGRYEPAAILHTSLNASHSCAPAP